MRNTNKKIKLYSLMAFVIVCILFWGQAALAADTNSTWRHTYDQVMKWLNFAILVFLIVKFGRIPIKNFLLGKKEKLEQLIKRIENEKAKAVDKVQETLQLIDQSAIEFEKLKERIVAQGGKNQKTIIEDAQHESCLMMAEAKVRINSKICHAKDLLKTELVDAAIDLAMEKLPGLITEEDNQRLIQQYIASADSK